MAGARSFGPDFANASSARIPTFFVKSDKGLIQCDSLLDAEISYSSIRNIRRGAVSSDAFPRFFVKTDRGLVDCNSIDDRERALASIRAFGGESAEVTSAVSSDTVPRFFVKTDRGLVDCNSIADGERALASIRAFGGESTEVTPAFYVRAAAGLVCCHSMAEAALATSRPHYPKAYPGVHRTIEEPPPTLTVIAGPTDGFVVSETNPVRIDDLATSGANSFLDLDVGDGDPLNFTVHFNDMKKDPGNSDILMNSKNRPQHEDGEHSDPLKFNYHFSEKNESDDRNGFVSEPRSTRGITSAPPERPHAAATAEIPSPTDYISALGSPTVLNMQRVGSPRSVTSGDLDMRNLRVAEIVRAHRESRAKSKTGSADGSDKNDEEIEKLREEIFKLREENANLRARQFVQ